MRKPLIFFLSAVILLIFACRYHAFAPSSPPSLSTHTIASNNLTFVEGPEAAPPDWPDHLPSKKITIVTSLQRMAKNTMPASITHDRNFGKIIWKP